MSVKKQIKKSSAKQSIEELERLSLQKDMKQENKDKPSYS